MLFVIKRRVNYINFMKNLKYRWVCNDIYVNLLYYDWE